MTKAGLLILVPVLLCATPAFAISNDDLQATLAQRLKDDRTGAWNLPSSGVSPSFATKWLATTNTG